ncbi:MAG TPA: 2'-deoxycytidine 5'-triphosphate deaminase [Gemmatimonadaceae bacterium]|nr:2'-deoxycytidine 5'-triphosphate deaminase [Gemmatimonadaceae bacterium]
MASYATDRYLPGFEPETASGSTTSTGVLPHQEIEALIAARRIRADEPITPDQVQPASFDVRLGAKCYRIRTSFLPGKTQRVATKLADLTMHELDLSEPTVLERGCVYLVEAMEEVHLSADVSARANPKSTTGRLDIFTRLITDHSDRFDRVERGYRGKLYVEVSPRTFSVRLQAGIRLNQIRFTRGQPLPADTHVHALHSEHTLLYDAKSRPLAPEVLEGGLWLRIDLAGDADGDIVGYRARRDAPVVDVTKIRHHPREEYWEPILAGKSRSLVLSPDEFYILVTAERVRVPLSYAAELVPIEPDVGEFRIHYAGFFDPGFGYGLRGEVKGTPGVLEVRSHEVPFLLEHEQKVGRLVYERLSRGVERSYGGDVGSSYHAQRLALAKQFR